VHFGCTTKKKTTTDRQKNNRLAISLPRKRQTNNTPGITQGVLTKHRTLHWRRQQGRQPTHPFSISLMPGKLRCVFDFPVKPKEPNKIKQEPTFKQKQHDSFRKREVALGQERTFPVQNNLKTK
jgi:hypothetical protein